MTSAWVFSSSMEVFIAPHNTAQRHITRPPRQAGEGRQDETRQDKTRSTTNTHSRTYKSGLTHVYSFQKNTTQYHHKMAFRFYNTCASRFPPRFDAIAQQRYTGGCPNKGPSVSFENERRTQAERGMKCTFSDGQLLYCSPKHTDNRQSQQLGHIIERFRLLRVWFALRPCGKDKQPGQEQT